MTSFRQAGVSGVVVLVVATAVPGTLRSVPASARSGAQEPSGLSGAWVLDREASELPGSGAPREGGGQPGGQGPGMGGGSGRPPGGMGGMGAGMGSGRSPGGDRQPSPEEMKRRRDLMREVLEPSGRLIITEQAGRIAFTDSQGVVRTYTADGKDEKHQLTNATVKTRTRWREGALVIETELEGGTKVTRTFALERDPRVLTVTTVVEGGRAPRDIPPVRAVYEPATEP